MHVRKFHSDTLDDALREIKKELGPDAIILKTVTNKGIKGAFKKKKIEITAAISEKNYVRKAKVDHVLSESQKESFYSNNSSYISNMIDNHSGPVVSDSSYGRLGLNRSVATVRKEEPKSVQSISMNLNDFLSEAPEQTEKPIQDSIAVSEVKQPQVISASSSRIDELERKVFELTKSLQEVSKTEPAGIYQLRTTLRSLDISESYLQQVIRKAYYELSTDEQDNPDSVFEFALNEMMTVIQTERPKFLSLADQGSITLLLSDISCGQTSMLMKFGALQENATLITLLKDDSSGKSNDFIQRMFGMNIIKAYSVPEVVAECRKAMSENKTVIVDYKKTDDNVDETKRFVEGIKRAFDKVEVLVSLSAIHSELYNRKIIAKYRLLTDGLTFSHLDLCLDFGALFNIANDERRIPFKFFGTGNVVPDDLEAATPERILAGIFQL